MSEVHQQYESEIVMPPFVAKTYNIKFNTEGLTKIQALYESDIIITPYIFSRYSSNFEIPGMVTKTFNSKMISKNTIEKTFAVEYSNTAWNWKSTFISQ